MSTAYSIGQMNQLADALEAAGYTPDDVTKLRSKPETLKQFKSVLIGMAEVVIKTHTIDCDAKPYVPEDCKVIGHQKGGQFRWNPDEVELWLCDEQNKGSIEGNELRKKLEDQPVLNANVLDYLLENPQLIPEEWKGSSNFFWGTLYHSPLGALVVRYLYWDGSEWNWDYDRWLDCRWNDSHPAAFFCK